MTGRSSGCKGARQIAQALPRASNMTLNGRPYPSPAMVRARCRALSTDRSATSDVVAGGGAIGWSIQPSTTRSGAAAAVN